MKDSVFYTKHTLNFGGKIVSIESPLVMGILNITPDSFYPAGRVENEKTLLEKAKCMLEEGAAILDIGGYSSRPGASDISEEEEIKRVIPSIKLLSAEFPDALISADTFRANVAVKAVEAGARMINDISAGELDDNMIRAVAMLKVPYVAMHMKGNPQNMNTLSNYKNLLPEIYQYFQNKLFNLHSLGITDIIIDPGFGFAKTRDQSFYLLDNLEVFKSLNAPVMAGFSRKSLIYKTLNVNPEEALNGTTVLNTVSVLKGASILRVHDVKEAVEIVKLTNEIRKGLN